MLDSSNALDSWRTGMRNWGSIQEKNKDGAQWCDLLIKIPHRWVTDVIYTKLNTLKVLF